MAAVELILHEDPEIFLLSVQDFLLHREDENGLILGTLEHFRSKPPVHPPNFMARAQLGSETVAAAFYWQKNLLITRGSLEVWEVVAQKLRENGVDVPGVAGPAVEAEWMTQAWMRIRGCTAWLAMDQRLYRLTRVEQPQGVPGTPRAFSFDELEQHVEWEEAFLREVLPHEPLDRDLVRESARKRVSENMAFFWEVEGVPVSMACLARPTLRGVSVNSVYTPPEFRGNGYGTALVAAVSEEGLRRGKEFCVLYTDLMNPVSNSIYQKVGYLPVCNTRNYRFRY